MRQYHTIDDFLNEKSFRDWVLKNDSAGSSHWQDWMETHGEKKELLLQAKSVLLELDRQGQDWDTKKQSLLFDKIKKRVDSKKGKQPAMSYPVHGSGKKNLAKSAVISLLAVFFLGYLYWSLSPLGILSDEGNAETKESWITKANPRGQKSKIHLPDGSAVFLNAESEIRFRNDFGQHNRDIFLTGESFFEVVPDSLLPFRVFSGDVVTTALGTSFNVNCYDKEKIQVRLATGIVKVADENDDDNAIILVPGEEAILDDHHKIIKQNFNLKKAFLWKDGTLLFDKSPFSDFKITLERWYGVDIEVINLPRQELYISGEFHDTYLSNILESIGYAYGFSYSIDQKKIKISFNQKDNR